MKIQTDAEVGLVLDPNNETLQNRIQEARNIRFALKLMMERPNSSRESRIGSRIAELEDNPMSAGNHTQFITNKKDK